VFTPVLLEYVPGAQESHEPADVAPAYHNEMTSLKRFILNTGDLFKNSQAMRLKSIQRWLLLKSHLGCDFVKKFQGAAYI
jgi:hypothetical protein